MMYVLFFFKSGISLYVQTQVIGSSSRRNFPFRDTDISNLRSASEPLGHITVINRLVTFTPTAWTRIHVAAAVEEPAGAAYS